MSYQDPYAPQDVYAQQQQLGGGNAYSPPSYTQPGAYPPPPQQPYGQPGAYPPPPQQPYGQPGAYPPPPQQPYGQPSAYPPNYVQAAQQTRSNALANGALISGVISLVLATITYVSQIGFAGLITGSFAIYRGIMALNRASRLPGNPGRAQAILAIAMGILAWVIVLTSLVVRGGTGF